MCPNEKCKSLSELVVLMSESHAQAYGWKLERPEVYESMSGWQTPRDRW